MPPIQVSAPAEPVLHPVRDMEAWALRDSAFDGTGVVTPERLRLAEAFLKDFSFRDNYRKLAELQGEVVGGRLWLDHSLLTLNYVVSVAPDAARPGMLDRAASLAAGTLRFFHAVRSGSLPAETMGGRALCMHQFANLIGRTLVPLADRGNWFEDCPAATHVAVLVGGRAYRVEVGAAYGAADEAFLRAQLDAVMALHAAAGDDLPLGVGLLTVGRRTECAALRARVGAAPDAAAMMAMLDSALFVLALDHDSRPVGREPTAVSVFHGCMGNRWYDKSLQWVVCANGEAGLVANYACYLDGGVGIYFAACVLQDVADTPPGRPVAAAAPPPVAFPADLPHDTLSQTAADTAALLRPQQGVFDIHGLGKNFFKAHGISPDSCVQMAVLLGTRRFFGKTLSLRQYVSLRHFKNGTLDLPYVTVPEVVQFVDAAMAGSDDTRLYGLLRDAVAAHKALVRKTAEGRSPKLVFNCVTRGLRPEQIQDLQALAAQYKARGLRNYVGDMFGLDGDTAELITSALKLYPRVLLAGRPGIRLPYLSHLGLHYFVGDEGVLFSYMPAPQCPDDVAGVHAEIAVALQRIADLLA